MAPVTKPKRQRRAHFIREWREHLGLKQDEAASRIGVTQSKISRIENGTTPYDQDFLEEAADAYGTTAAALLTGIPGRADDISSKFNQLNNKERDQILDLIDFLLSKKS